MPAAVVAAVAAAGTAIGGVAGAFLIMNAGAIASVSLLAGSLAVGNHQRRKAKQRAIAAYNASLEDRLVMTATTNGPRSRCYGRVRNADGVLFKATHGPNKEFYTLVVAVAGHEIDGFESVYFGDKLVTLDVNGYVQTAPYQQSNKGSGSQIVTLNGSGGATVNAGGTVIAGSASAAQHATGSTDEAGLSVSVAGSTITVSGGFAGATATVSWQTATGQSYARVRFYTGAPGQDLSTVLQPIFPSLITAGQHRFAGIACMLVDLEYNPDAFPGGVPDITAVFRGARVLDPRTNTTAWTENPALIARDWALNSRGGGLAIGDINAASFNAAANACDVVQAFTTTSGTSNLPLYTCGIVARMDDGDPSGAFAEMVEAMAGKAGWAGGQMRVVAGVYRAPVATITEDWVIDAQPVQVVPEPPTDEAVNLYRPTIADKDQAYVVVPAPEVRAASYITADGRELPREITLGGVTDTTHAQHVCGVMMREARNGLTAVLPCNLRAFQLELFDIVSVTLPRYGWSAKTFEVMDWQFSMTGGVTLTLKETAAAIFQPDAGFDVLDLTPNTALPDPSIVPTVGALTVTSGTTLLSDGTPVTRARVQWPASGDGAVSRSGSVEIQYWPATTPLPSADWIAAPAAPGAAIETTITGLKASVYYLFRARFVNALGVKGAWSTQAFAQMADPPAQQWADIANRPADSALLNSYQTIGQNLIPESDQAQAVRFELRWNPNGATFAASAVPRYATEAAWTTADFDLAGGRLRNVFVYQTNRHTGTVFTADVDQFGNTLAGEWEIPNGRVPTIAGQRVCASLYGHAHRSTWEVVIGFSDVSGNLISLARGSNQFAPDGFTNRLALYGRSHVIAVAPANSATCFLIARKYNTAVGSTDSYFWWTAPQIEAVAADATGPGPYMPGPAAAVSHLGYVGDLNATRGAPAGTLVGTTLATTVESNASSAAASAAASAALLATMRSNGFLDASEKPAIIREWNAISGEVSGIQTQAAAFGVSITAYTSAYNALAAYLGSLSPAWFDAGQDTPIVVATDQAVWLGYYNARQALLNAIADEAGRRALWAGVTGTGRPADNATRNDVYRQASDPAVPSGVADGSIWQNTTTGRTFQRVAGVWEPYVGNSSVDTAQLATGAATELDADSAASGTWTIPSGSTRAFITYVCWSKWTNTTGSTVSVDFSGFVEVRSADAGYASGLRALIEGYVGAVDPSDFDSLDGDQVNGYLMDAVEWRPINRTGRVTAAPGDTVYCTVRLSLARGAENRSILWRRAQTTLAAIKR